MARSTHPDEAVRITTAATSRAADIATRQRRYLWSMSLRSACFIGAGVAALTGVAWLWPILIVGALVLPYIAVVLANAATTRTDVFELQKPVPTQRQLNAGPRD